jgi:hypothetical protein
MRVLMMQGSSQGIFACRAGTRAPPAGMHETNDVPGILTEYYKDLKVKTVTNSPTFSNIWDGMEHSWDTKECQNC